MSTEPQWTIEQPVNSWDELKKMAEQLAGKLKAGDMIILSGTLGAGKTTFVQNLGRALGIGEKMPSPTFVLSRVYSVDSETAAKRLDVTIENIVHVDAYRLSGPDEIDDLDLEYYADSGVLCVEWGQGKVEHITPNYLTIDISIPPSITQFPTAQTSVEETNDNDIGEPRIFTVSGFGSRWKEPAWIMH